MVASLEHPMAYHAGRVGHYCDTANTRPLPAQRPTGEWSPRVPAPYVSEQALWYRSYESPRQLAPGAELQGTTLSFATDTHSRPWTNSNPPPLSAADGQGATIFANLSKPPHEMQRCWRSQIYNPKWTGPATGWATELLPPRSANYAASLLGPTGRPITEDERSKWSPRQATLRMEPMFKPKSPRDPIWGVDKEEVPKTLPVLQYMTTMQTYSDASAWKNEPRPDVKTPVSEQPRGRYHVDPRGC